MVSAALQTFSSFLSTYAANKLAVSFILSRLDYCNSLLAGIPDYKLNKLQRIQNHIARLVLRKSRPASATALLRTLHWLPVKARIQYKIACLCFQCIYQNNKPPYISNLLHPYYPSRTALYWHLSAVCLFVGCLTSQQQARVSQGRICSDNFTCCHTEIEVADQTFYLTQSQYTDTEPTSPSADPITPGAWQGSHWSANA